MLEIRLSKPSSEGGGGAKPADTVTVACPHHLVLADLPVAKSLGSANASSVVKIVGRRSRRQIGEKVHFCVRCGFPIAIYGRLSPCKHVFCLDCARSDSICYMCDERIEKIRSIKLMETIFVCAAPHCLKSFLEKTEFESHMHEAHADLLDQNTEKNGNNSEVATARKPTSDSTVQAPARPRFSPAPNPQHRDQKPPRPLRQSKTTPPFISQLQDNPSDQQTGYPLCPLPNPGMEWGQAGSSMDSRVGEGILGSRPLTLAPPAPLPPSQLSQLQTSTTTPEKQDKTERTTVSGSARAKE